MEMIETAHVLIALKPSGVGFAASAGAPVVGLNVAACRVPTDGEQVTINRFTDGMKPFGEGAGHPYESTSSQGRWPAPA